MNIFLKCTISLKIHLLYYTKITAVLTYQIGKNPKDCQHISQARLWGDVCSQTFLLKWNGEGFHSCQNHKKHLPFDLAI
jgi:hypothetical protein